MRAKHLGFLHGSPKCFNGQNRWQKFKREFKRDPKLPPIDAGEYLFEAFINIGLAKEKHYGVGSLEWIDIHAFMQCTGDISDVWEARLLKAMSSEYVSGRNIGDDEFGIPPWNG